MDVLGFRPTRSPHLRLSRLLLAAGLVLGALALSAGTAAAHNGRPQPQWSRWHHHRPGRPSKSRTCAGTPEMPGTLAGFYRGNVTIEGVCAVNSGQAVVKGDLTISPGSTLAAVFGLDDQTGSGNSSLTVFGDVKVQKGATAFLGCEPVHSSCLDDPNPEPGTLSSRERLFGNLIENEPLGVVLHNSVIGGNIKETGGGGGVTCEPSGAFLTLAKSPVFSDYEDLTVYGNVSVTGLQSCWMGFARDKIYGNLRVINDQLFDPDAIEILANEIEGNLVCRENKMVWDSADETEALYPRLAEPNTVEGRRRGQCVYASPATEGGPLGTTPF